MTLEGILLSLAIGAGIGLLSAIVEVVLRWWHKER